MQTPLEIAFHNVPPSRGVEASIRRRVAKLDRMYDRLVGCRVSVEALHQQHRTGNVVSVHIEMKVAGGTLAVTREPHRASDQVAKPNVQSSPRQAFHATEERLKSFKEQQRGDAKAHTPMFEGHVSEIFPDKDYGFIRTDAGTQLYFHRQSLMGGQFEDLKPGDAVHFEESAGDTGPAAAKVWVGPDYHLD